MLQEFLLPETTVREAGAGSQIDLGGQVGGTLLLTLGITRIIISDLLRRSGSFLRRRVRGG